MTNADMKSGKLTCKLKTIEYGLSPSLPRWRRAVLQRSLSDAITRTCGCYDDTEGLSRKWNPARTWPQRPLMHLLRTAALPSA